MGCVRCGTTNPDGPDVRFCRACGAELLPSGAAVAVTSPVDADGHAAAPAIVQTSATTLRPFTAPEIVTPSTLSPGVVHVAVSPYGGFWIRLLARVIDEVILLGTDVIVLFALGFAQAIYNDLADPEVAVELPGTIVWLVIFVVAIPYRWLFPPLLGATPGKLMLGYHIVDGEGVHIGLKRSLARMLAQILSAIVLGLGFFWIAFDPRKQGWHDQIAHTFVVRKELVRSSSRESGELVPAA